MDDVTVTPADKFERAYPTPEQYVQAYKAFMYNPHNVRNCSECPENCGSFNNNYGHPCGQPNCWVTAHCHPERLMW